MFEQRENSAEAEEKGKKKIRILLRTFGWPMVTVARDDFAAF